MTTVYTFGELVGHSGILVAHCRRNFTHSNERRAVPSAMAWLLIIYILPLVGIIAYLPLASLHLGKRRA